MEYYALIVAGGTGSRMDSDLPKQFILIAGKPVIVHTLNKFLEFRNDIRFVISIHPEWRSHLYAILEEYFPSVSFYVVDGGATRFHSVKNGLDAISSDDVLVGIHDAARPLVSVSTIERCFLEARLKGNACPVTKVNDSLRQITSNGSVIADRSHYRVVQTPQCFQISLLKKAFTQEYSPVFTDDASVLEHFGEKINLVEGNAENVKITYPSDLIFADALLSRSK